MTLDTLGNDVHQQAPGPTAPAAVLPLDLVDPILIFLTLHVHSSSLSTLGVRDVDHESPTASPTLAPIFVGKSWSKPLLHLFYTRLLPLVSPKPAFSYWSAARANRLDRMAFLLSVYGDPTSDRRTLPWHSSPTVAQVLSPESVQRAIEVAIGKQFFHVLDWLVAKHGARIVLDTLNAPVPEICPLVEATHKGKLKALQWWIAAARQAQAADPDSDQAWWLTQVEFDVIEASMRCARAPIECLRWWVHEYLPYHSEGDDRHADAAALMFNYVHFCFASNQPGRAAWWIDENPLLFVLALDVHTLPTLDADLTASEQALLAAVLALPFAFVQGDNPATCALAYIVHAPHFRARFKLELAHALVDRASTFPAAIAWWALAARDSWAVRAGTMDRLAATALSESDAHHAIHLFAAGLLPADQESEVAVDLASARGCAHVCRQWAFVRRDKLKYSHVALEEAVANAREDVVDFWLTSGLPLKWRGSILMWASVPGDSKWVERVRKLWRKFGVDIQGTVPWDDEDEDDDDDDAGEESDAR